jgi:hypothetical protein
MMARHLDTVTGLTAVHEVVVKDDFHAARQLSGRCAFGHF